MTNALLTVVMLAAIPVTTPEELGRLTVDSVTEVGGGWGFTVTYENDTGAPIDKLRLECTTIDHREAVVNTNSLEIAKITLGEVRRVSFEVRDATHRSSRAECRIAGARRPK